MIHDSWCHIVHCQHEHLDERRWLHHTLNPRQSAVQCPMMKYMFPTQDGQQLNCASLQTLVFNEKVTSRQKAQSNPKKFYVSFITYNSDKLPFQNSQE
ncbi:hypothetical protein E2C01_006603 [Portunus trituberculatus]|uniref:Uncharacterized protein n=1 Tax=Portunus trituberculatus TaxID=210409 RepID=A0A5B7CYL3_PORTR|nr:hypothetical protein [Portunus trituberculatus]